MKISIERCARCGRNHKWLSIRKFRRPPPDATYFAICPNTKEPILVKVEVSK